VDIFSHRRMPILAVSRLHLIDPSSIEHNSACLECSQLNDTVTRDVARIADRVSTVGSVDDGTYSVAVPRAWNNLPLHIRHIFSMDFFSKNSKSVLFSRAF